STSSSSVSWNDDRVSRLEADVLSGVVSLESLLVVEGNLVLLARFATQNVNLLRVGVGRQATRSGDRLQRRHARRHGKRTHVTDLADDKDPLAVDCHDHDRDIGILNVLLQLY